MVTDEPPGGRGGRWLRAVLLVLLVALAVVVLFLWVFPWVESIQQDPTLGAAGPTGEAHSLRLPR